MKKIHLLFSCIISGIFLAGSVTSASKQKQQLPDYLAGDTLPGWLKQKDKTFINMYIDAFQKKDTQGATDLMNAMCGKSGMFRAEKGKRCADYGTRQLAEIICKGHQGSLFARPFRDSECAKVPPQNILSKQELSKKGTTNSFQKVIAILQPNKSEIAPVKPDPKDKDKGKIKSALRADWEKELKQSESTTDAITKALANPEEITMEQIVGAEESLKKAALDQNIKDNITNILNAHTEDKALKGLKTSPSREVVLKSKSLGKNTKAFLESTFFTEAMKEHFLTSNEPRAWEWLAGALLKLNNASPTTEKKPIQSESVASTESSKEDQQKDEGAQQKDEGAQQKDTGAQQKNTETQQKDEGAQQ